MNYSSLEMTYVTCAHKPSVSQHVLHDPLRHSGAGNVNQRVPKRGELVTSRNDRRPGDGHWRENRFAPRGPVNTGTSCRGRVPGRDHQPRQVRGRRIAVGCGDREGTGHLASRI